MDIKNDFHIAKLSLFNVRLLNSLDCSNEQAVRGIISKECDDNNIKDLESLLHQATFLGHAYVCIVWLRECIERDKEVKQRFLDNMNELFDPDWIAKKSGPRQVDSASSLLRLLRNALSHAHVRVSDKYFVFTDCDKKAGEDRPTGLWVTWACVGEICDCVVSVLNTILYPDASGPR